MGKRTRFKGKIMSSKTMRANKYPSDSVIEDHWGSWKESFHRSDNTEAGLESVERGVEGEKWGKTIMARKEARKIHRADS